MTHRYQRTSSVLALLASACAHTTGRPVAASAPEQLTPVLVSVLNPPRPAVQTDGVWKLAYELELMNATDLPMTIEAVEIRDPQRSNRTIATLTEGDINAHLTVPGAGHTTTLAAAQNGVLLINLTFASREEMPQALEHVMTVTTTPNPKVPPRIVATVARTVVDPTAPRVIGPPLRGPRWIAAASCCESYHRRAVLPVSGRRTVAQRFAIDWMQTDGQRRLASGDPQRNESYPQYGADLLAVADGTVVHVVDGLPDGTPGAFPAGVSLNTADGNSVILDLGDGVFALYAHLQPGSVRVHPGDHVKRGDVLGLLGNSGNSDAPHLHFHLTDGPSALSANGVPYVIDAFDVTGHAVSADDLDTELKKPTEPITIQIIPGATRRSKQLPADLVVVEFPK